MQKPPLSPEYRDTAGPLHSVLDGYTPRTEAHRAALIDPVFKWLQTSRHKNRVDIARGEIHDRFQKMEEGILAHFAKFAGGPNYLHRDEAWRLACRQREFVREACARMAEGEYGEPTSLSEAIREVDFSERVKIIPDYSKGLRK